MEVIELRCKQCQVPVDVHHAYLDNDKLYLQGECPECGESIRFSAGSLYIHLLTGGKKAN